MGQALCAFRVSLFKAMKIFLNYEGIQRQEHSPLVRLLQISILELFSKY